MAASSSSSSAAAGVASGGAPAAGGADGHGASALGPAAEIVEALRADARSKLLDVLDETLGRKDLVMDRSIVGPLDLIVNSNDLREHGVQSWHKLSDGAISNESTQMIFLVRCSHVDLVDWIAAQILADEAAKIDRGYVVVFLPRKTEQCIQRLNRANVRANVTVKECAIHFFPSDRDVLSMETPAVFADYHAHGDVSGIFYAAKAIMFLQSKFGVIPSVHSIGAAGKIVVDVILRLAKEERAGTEQAPRPGERAAGAASAQPGVPPIASRRPPTPQQTPQQPSAAAAAGASQVPGIDEVIVIDRRVDLFSVMCSQFTYEALVDMVFGISNGVADLGSAASATGRRPEQGTTVRLSADDPVYRDIRDVHIDQLGQLLQDRAQAIQRTFAEKDTIRPSEMPEYMKRFKTASATHKPLEIHINLAQEIKAAIHNDDYKQHLKLEDEISAQSSQSPLESIEDWVDDKKPFHEVMRLLCFFSLVSNGIKAKQLDQIKRSILQAYGYEHLLTLCNMERAGLLRYFQQKSVWAGIKRQFQLFPDDPKAGDISYAYSGYAPLSVRLVEMTRSGSEGWRSRKDALSLLYGPAQELQQAPAAGGRRPLVTLVVFVGGITYGELAALRKLSESEDGRRRFLVLTTEMLNPKKLFESMRCKEVAALPLGEARRQRPQAEPKKSAGFISFWPSGR